MERMNTDQLTIMFPQDLAAFLIDRQGRGLSDRTIEFYQRELHIWQTFLQQQGVQSVLQVQPQHIRVYFIQLAETRNPGGLHAAYRAIRAFLYWYEAEIEPPGWKNPIRKVAAPKQASEILKPVPLPDLKAMLATCERRTLAGDRDRAILLALLDTGCRASEFVALDVGNVNWSTGAVTILHGKGNKARVTFLGKKARRAVMRYMRHRTITPTSPLWTTQQDDSRLTYAGLRQVVRRRAARAGVKTPSLHSFRRGFALLSLRAGMNIYSLQKLMGHSDLSVLRRYLAQTEDDLQRAHEAAGPVDSAL